LSEHHPERVVVIGSGAREHALAERLSTEVDSVICIPGNPGMAKFATCLPADLAQLDELTKLILDQHARLIVVGPEQPLVDGLANRLRAKFEVVFGPDHEAAQIEGSKVFMKELATRARVPTAPYLATSSLEEAKAYILQSVSPLVVKADGLCAGKGVVVCSTADEAIAAAEAMLVNERFGKAGRRIVIEERLEGREVSAMALVSEDQVVLLPTAQDYKRRFDGDRGPMTGGMGAVSPAPGIDGPMKSLIEGLIIRTARQLVREDKPYRGALFAGLMLTRKGPMLLEFNCRFGDPETQAVVERIEDNFYELLLMVALHRSFPISLQESKEAVVNVVLCAKSYPEKSSKGVPIYGVEEAGKLPCITIFHAGTARNDKGELVTNGGRVLSVAALGATIAQARSRAYEAVSLIKCDDLDYRTDIAAGL
jgi:phosphoribosylamine--glycine ligase